jgi:hypothetical protein
MIRSAIAVAVLAIATLTGIGGAQSAPQGSDSAPGTGQVAQTAAPAVRPAGTPPIYIPPRRGAPTDVAPAATRSPPVMPKVKLLAPDHTGLTVAAQPTLYMYVAEKGRLQVLIARAGDVTGANVASARIELAEGPAIRPLALSELNATLEPGVEYRVTLMFFDRAGSVRATESAMIRRVAEPLELTVITSGAAPDAQARAYASAGIWFDAVAAIGRAVAAAPAAPGPRQDRAALLEQAGLPEIAQFDRGALRR